jgi:gliding motility associated protien GldN
VPENIVTESSDTDDDQFLDGIVKRDLLLERRLIPYEYVREADVPWERMIWRVIDLREKINLPFSYPAQPFVKILFESARNGEIAVFERDDFKNPMNPDEIDQMLFRMDTTEVVDLETYETKLVVTRNELNYSDIKRIRLKEIWYFDEELSRMKVRILGISPIKDEYDDNGNFKYELPMFWVYYPQSRETLSRFRSFVSGNDAAPVTWEQVFEMRKFSSYIYKATNVLDNRIQDYEYLADNPREQLWESERIKAELFNFEHDLWSW